MRTLDADKYRINIPAIRALLDPKTDEERLAYIGNLAIITGVPIIIVGVYVRELYGDIPGLAEKHERLMRFYQIDEVIFA